jgi:hypothetical protein
VGHGWILDGELQGVRIEHYYMHRGKVLAVQREVFLLERTIEFQCLDKMAMAMDSFKWVPPDSMDLDILPNEGNEHSMPGLGDSCTD